ncbi:hypothetical protein [Candidatus Tremblaya phenacola]|uniref:aspartate kinase n=1 Tax=Candidatus Tremblayella phenacoccinincola TaxID=1010676 RepID=A0A2G0V715_9PROT|nr:hypothetical protein [Candidatus Tremblaya phenacola]PHN16257.1 Lysine-sensitive aspartokinase 3 [Candidatus Tremblaya phenacola]
MYIETHNTGTIMTKLIIQKYGGSSVASEERIMNVAKLIAKSTTHTEKVIVIVSAMQGNTSRLVSVLKKIDPTPNLTSADFTIAAGEQISVGLLSAALWKDGVSNVPLTGWQAPIYTDHIHTNSHILLVNTGLIRKSFSNIKAILITGFQGLSLHKMTTFGRGGSDTSALALSCVFKGGCLIYTDVKGVYTIDPRITKQSKLIGLIAFEELFELASFGSKVIHTRSMLLSGKFNVSLTILSSFLKSTSSQKTNTIVHFNLLRNRNQMEQPIATSITFQDKVAQIDIIMSVRSNRISWLMLKALFKTHSKLDIVSCFSNDLNRLIFSFLVSSYHMEKLERKILLRLRRFCEISKTQTDNRISEVSVVGLGLRNSGYALSILLKLGVKVKALLTSEIRLTTVVKQRDLMSTLSGLHKHLF